ncbi:MAG: flippase-like domain-containing protein [Chloroflexi bacterium]|nr:flippase-like domain-containing protein [Chloroflexota bacterium]
MRRHWRVLALGAVVSGVVIVLIARQIDFALLWESLRTANYAWLIPAVLLTALGLFTRALRWRVLLGGKPGLTRAFHILNIAYLLNGVLPMRLGEVGRAWLASRGADGVPIMRTASTIVVERLLDLLAVAVFIAIGLAVGPMPDALKTTGLITGAAAFGGFLFLIVLANRRDLATALFHRAAKLIPGSGGRTLAPRLAEWLDHLLDGLQPIAQFGSLIAALFWTGISWFISFLTGMILMLVFYPEADAVATLLFIASASFAVALPAVPGNVGPYEGSILLALTALGYTASPEGMATATAFALIVHASNIGTNAVLGVFGLVAEGVSLSQIARRADESDPTTP